MPYGKKVLLAFALAVGIYGLLSIPFTPVRHAYRHFFRVSAGVFYGQFGREGTVRFEPKINSTREDLDVLIRKGATQGRVPISTGRVGYVPTAELIALILATPVPWKRRAWSLLWGLILVNAFVFLRLGLMIFRWYCAEPALRQFETGPILSKIINTSFEILFVAPTGSIVIPALIWMVVIFRRDDLNSLAQLLSDQRSSEQKKLERT